MTRLTLLLIQAPVYGAVLFALGRLRPLRDLFRALPLQTRAALSIGLGLCLVAQLIQSLQASYPFIGWSMYARAEPASPAYIYSCEGMTPRGERVAVDPSSLFPAIRPGFLDWRIHKLLDKSAESQEAERILRILARQYTALQFDRIEIHRLTLGTGSRKTTLVRVIHLR